MQEDYTIKDYGITDFGGWLSENHKKAYRMWYRDKREISCTYIKIHNAIEVPGDILLELEIDPWGEKNNTYREFELLSRIKLAYCDADQLAENG